MIVKFYGKFKKICQTKSYKLKVIEDINIKEVINLIVDEYGREFEDIIYNNNTISKKVLILLNNTNIYHQEGLETTIKDNDIVKILPVTAGG